MQLGLELLIDHGTNEVIEAEIMLRLAGFVERRLRIGCTFELGFKTKAVLVEEFALLIGGGIGELIGIDEGGGTLGSFAEMLQMSEFVALRRCLLVIAFVLLKIDFRMTFFGVRAICAMQMFLARNEFVPGVKGTRCEVNARGIKNFCHIA